MKQNEAVQAATRLAELLCREAHQHSRDPLVIYMALLLAARTEIFKFEQVIDETDLPRFREDAARVQQFVAEDVQMIAMPDAIDEGSGRIVSIPIQPPGSQGPVS